KRLYQIDQSRLLAAEGSQLIRDLLQRTEYPLHGVERRSLSCSGAAVSRSGSLPLLINRDPMQKLLAHARCADCRGAAQKDRVPASPPSQPTKSDWSGCDRRPKLCPGVRDLSGVDVARTRRFRSRFCGRVPFVIVAVSLGLVASMLAWQTSSAS